MAFDANAIAAVKEPRAKSDHLIADLDAVADERRFFTDAGEGYRPEIDGHLLPIEQPYAGGSPIIDDRAHGHLNDMFRFELRNVERHGRAERGVCRSTAQNIPRFLGARGRIGRIRKLA